MRQELHTYDGLEKRIQSQILLAGRFATRACSAGDKPDAFRIHKLKKSATADFAAVRSLRANGRPIPVLRISAERMVEERECAELGMQEIGVRVVQVWGMGGGKMDMWCVW